MSGLVRITVVLLFGLLLASAHGGRNAAAQTIFDPYIAAIFGNTSSTASTNQQAFRVLDAYAQARRALRVVDREQFKNARAPLEDHAAAPGSRTLPPAQGYEKKLVRRLPSGLLETLPNQFVPSFVYMRDDGPDAGRD